MITYDLEDYAGVQRDNDLVRDLLLRIDSDQQLDGSKWVHYGPADLGMADRTETEIGYHLNMLVEEGFVKGTRGIAGGIPMISKLTWKGHDFIDNIRDPGIWSKTKKRVEGLSGVAIGIMASIAQAEVKKHLGLP